MDKKNLLKIKMLENDIKSYDELANKLGTSRQNIYNKLKGKTKWKYYDIDKLKKILSLTENDISIICFN